MLKLKTTRRKEKLLQQLSPFELKDSLELASTMQEYVTTWKSTIKQ